MSESKKKIAVIGLDSVPPEMMFQKLLDKLPNIKRMYERGIHGSLETCHPPITVPAWMVMMTGKNPGKLGIYGFRHRRGFSYNDGYIVNSTSVKEKTVWEILSEHGKSSIVLGVPPGYPPKQVKNCNIVSCFITPGIEKTFTYPQELKDEVLNVSGGNYIFDVTFRTENREKIKEELFEMTSKRFDVAEYLAQTKPWDFFIMHEIGFDRLHHAFWKFFDPSHPKYVKGTPYEKLDEEYYRFVDERIGRLLEIFGEECITFVLSDHGSKGMSGAFCVNQWLEAEGYLRFKKKPQTVLDFDKPDLMVYFDDLNWRSAGTVGHDSLYLFENDTGPDDSVHSMNGIFLLYDPKKRDLSLDGNGARELEGARIEDIAPTLLELFGLDGVKDKRELFVGMDGKSLSSVVRALD